MGELLVSQSAEIAILGDAPLPQDGPDVRYNIDLKTPIYTEINANPKAWVHSVEWRKVLASEPVAIDVNFGEGFKVMTIDEWTSAWKRNDDFPDCLACGSMRTKEHHFTQDWCRGAKRWESEAFCSDCHCWSWRSYVDPGWLSGSDVERLAFDKFVCQNRDYDAERRSKLPQ